MKPTVETEAMQEEREEYPQEEQFVQRRQLGIEEFKPKPKPKPKPNPKPQPKPKPKLKPKPRPIS